MQTAVPSASERSHAQLAFELYADAPALAALEEFRAYMASADPYDPATAPIPY